MNGITFPSKLDIIWEITKFLVVKPQWYHHSLKFWITQMLIFIDDPLWLLPNADLTSII